MVVSDERWRRRDRLASAWALGVGSLRRLQSLDVVVDIGLGIGVVGVGIWRRVCLRCDAIGSLLQSAIFWIEALELDSRVVDGELPIDLASDAITPCLPSLDGSHKRLLIGNAPIKALARKHAQFDFGHVEPAAVLGSVVNLEFFGKTSRQFRGESFVE